MWEPGAKEGTAPTIMSICHTVRYRVQNTRQPEAREAIDAYLSALDGGDEGARLLLITTVAGAGNGCHDLVQVILCEDDRGCPCDDPTPVSLTFQAALAPLLDGTPERHDYQVLHVAAAV